MSRRRRRKHPKADNTLAEATSRASPESEARFPSHLSPIIQCKKSVLDRSQLELTAGVIVGILQAAVPMNAITRSVFLLIVLALLIDVAWRSPWSHAWRRTSKILATAFLTALYLIIAAILITYEHPSIIPSVKTYLDGHATQFFRWLYFAVGFVVAHLLSKLISLLKNYFKNRRAEKLAILQKFRETQKGWLDHRLASEESSKRLHFFVARLSKEMRGLAFIFNHASWFIGKDGKKQTVVGAQARAYLLTMAFERCSIKLEPDISEMEATAGLFIESTEGFLKTVEIVTKRDYEQLAGLHEYFKEQLKDVRDVANVLAKFPPTFEKARGISQDLTATINRQTIIWRAEVAIMRKVETHCARMVKATQDYFDRSILKASQELLSKLQDIVKLMKAS